MLLASATAIQAECVSLKYCELINTPDTRIFTARVLNSIDDGLAWRVRVTHAFFGKTRGDVDVYVNAAGEYLSPAKLDVGREYLLIARTQELPGYRRILTNGTSCPAAVIPWGDVGQGDRLYFEGLSGTQADGRISGNIDVIGPSSNAEPIAGTHVRLSDSKGKQIARTTADANGDFEFRSLSPGRYVVTADMPRRQFELDQDSDDGKVALSAHACQTVSLTFKRRGQKPTPR